MADFLLGGGRNLARPASGETGRPGAYPPVLAANHSRRLRERRRPGRAALGVALAAGVIAGLLRRVERLEIFGDSMRPALEPGDRVLVFRGTRPRRGHVVALEDPRRPERTMVKRVAAGPGETVTLTGGLEIHADRRYILLGDNTSATTDSRHFGPVDRDRIRGTVLYRYFPPERRGAVFRAPNRVTIRSTGPPGRDAPSTM